MHSLLQVKQLLPRPRVLGRHFPICQLDVEGVRIEVSSMHTLPPIRLQAAGAAATRTAGSGSGSGRAVVPPDAAQMLDKGPKEAVAAAVAAAKAAGAQVRQDVCLGFVVQGLWCLWCCVSREFLSGALRYSFTVVHFLTMHRTLCASPAHAW